jgi:hypothetical protein
VGVTERRGDDNFEQGVMVDVGMDAGAVVVYTPDAMLGREIEISRVGENDHLTHTEVLKRKTGVGYVSAAVFGSLPEGDYQLWRDPLGSPLDIHVTSGQVLEVDWR